MPEVSLDSLDAFGWLTNILVLAATVAVFVVLSIPKVRQSRQWRAVATRGYRRIRPGSVQGFETSRYMGNVYSADERSETMRYAQLFSAAVADTLASGGPVEVATYGKIGHRDRGHCLRGLACLTTPRPIRRRVP